MNTGGEAAEQIVRMSLEGFEVAAKITGAGAKNIAILLYSILKEEKKTKGKARLTSMLRSGKELKVFTVKNGDLNKFTQEAKKYGVLYCVLKDNKAEDGLTDIMVRAEDAGKINRIFERFGLATVDMGSVKTEIQQTREEKSKSGEDIPTPERTAVEDKLEQFLEAVTAEQPNPTAEQPETENPTMARTAKSRPSEPSSGSRSPRGDVGVSEREVSRPSVREELREIRREQRQKSPETDRERVHIPARIKKDEEVSL